MATHWIRLNIGFWDIIVVCFPKEASRNIITKVKRFAVEAVIVGAELGALVGRKDVLINSIRTGQNCRSWDLVERRRIFTYNTTYMDDLKKHLTINRICNLINVESSQDIATWTLTYIEVNELLVLYNIRHFIRMELGQDAPAGVEVELEGIANPFFLVDTGGCAVINGHSSQNQVVVARDCLVDLSSELVHERGCE
ncbi:hypothetical protein CHS0354_010650, partial [Potamilus streckersoni]